MLNKEDRDLAAAFGDGGLGPVVSDGAPEYTPLKGEGEVQYVKRTRMRRQCELCEEPAAFRHSFLLEGARRNPASSAYRRDDCSWCSDAETFVCAAHELPRHAPHGHDWCATFPLAKFPHMGLYWDEEPFTPKEPQ